MTLVRAAAVKNIKNAAGQTHSFMPKSFKYIILSIITGLLAVFSFPKISLFFLVWVSLVPLIYVLFKSSVKMSFFYGLLAGFVFNAAGLYWLVPMLQFNTGSYVQAFFAAGALWLYLALFWGAWSFFLNVSKRYFAYPAVVIVFSSCVWVLLEYARTYFLTGFPWMLIGYSQYRFTEIIQIAEFTSVYGVSFIVVLVNMLLYFWLVNRKGKVYLYLALAVIVATALFGAYRADKFKFFGTEEFKVAVVQPDVDQYKKWDYSFRSEILLELEDFAYELSDKNVDLAVWPETALPAFIPYDKQVYEVAKKITGTAGTFSIIGAPYNDESGRMYNAVFAFDGDEQGYKEVHKKNHLVPFGEFVPFKNLLGRFFGILNQLGDFKRGTDATVFTNGKIFTGPTICSENFFPDISRRFCLSGAKVLTNHTNDAWFFDTAAPHQHFMMNIFRSIENRKAMLVSANSGISGIIEASGRVVSSSKVAKSELLTGTFLQNDYKTFYTEYGDIFVRVCAVLILLMLLTILII